MSLEGSICLYQGEELGLKQSELDYSELADPAGLTFWPDNKGREGCRTPMPWQRGAPYAGFSEAAETWLHVKAPHHARAVSAQAKGGVLDFYRRMLASRLAEPALRTGRTRFVGEPEPVLAFWRGETHFCAFNLGPEATDIAFPAGVTERRATEGVTASDRLHLRGNGVFSGDAAG